VNWADRTTALACRLAQKDLSGIFASKKPRLAKADPEPVLELADLILAEAFSLTPLPARLGNVESCSNAKPSTKKGELACD
jgi:hypothetical protein